MSLSTDLVAAHHVLKVIEDRMKGCEIDIARWENNMDIAINVTERLSFQKLIEDANSRLIELQKELEFTLKFIDDKTDSWLSWIQIDDNAF